MNRVTYIETVFYKNRLIQGLSVQPRSVLCKGAHNLTGFKVDARDVVRVRVYNKDDLG